MLVHLQQRLVLLVLALLAVCGVAVLARPVLTDRTAHRALQQSLDTFVRTNGIAPGVSAYVSGPNGTWQGAAGLADVASRTPMRPDTRVRLESVSKAWTSTLILQLAGEGKLALGDKVSKWLPGLLPYGNRITIGELLSHTSGLIDNNDILAQPNYYIGRVRDPKLRAQLRATGEKMRTHPALQFSPLLWIRFAAALPLLSQPGTTYHYSNIGYEVAGLIAEKASGKTLAQLNRDGIIGPLGLKAAAYDPQGPIAGPHATLYYVAPALPPRDASAWHGGIGGEGGIVSDAADEAHFLQALMGGKLLRPAELLELQTPQPGAGDYTLGFVRIEAPCGGIAYQHGGGGAGDKTAVVVSPDGKRVAVVLANGSTDKSPSYYATVDNLATQLYCAA